MMSQTRVQPKAILWLAIQIEIAIDILLSLDFSNQADQPYQQYWSQYLLLRRHQ